MERKGKGREVMGLKGKGSGREREAECTV